MLGNRWGRGQVVLTLALASAVPQEAIADPITVRIRGQMAIVDDHSGVLGGSIGVGTPFTGTYTFDGATADTNGDVTVGDYWQNAAPAGVRLEIGGHVFRTDPDHVNFLLEVVNRSSDHFVFHSYNNLGPTSDALVEFISWQLDDFSGSVLNDDGLLLTAPLLPQWTSDFGLSIMGGAQDPFAPPAPPGSPPRIDPSRRFFIRGHVEEAVIEPGGPDPGDPNTCNALMTCLANASAEQLELIRGPQGPLGPAGPTGPQGEPGAPGTSDLPPGTVVFLLQGTSPPSGWTLLGRGLEVVHAPDGSSVPLRFDVYRKN